ncbi:MULTISPECIES: hypothetical protein [Bacillaceae]|uniref:hypothetical protein n=1 Tax=Bacillaceae TaxID=186817 RepID=UPI000D72CCFA|nr:MULTISPECIES: hypothetical protein [Bacillaceae]MCA1203329.1 hypothetical protein [Priestia flexa]
MDQCNCCTSSSNVACNISAFNSEKRRRYEVLRKELTETLSVKGIINGYTFVFPNDQPLLLKIAEWITLENRCCPFIKFSLNVSGDSESIRVELTGNEDVKNLLKEEFQL